MIRLDGVGIERGGHVVLQDASLAVGASELLVVSGARGAGKSTLAAVAAARLAPALGAVLLAGRDVASLQRSSLPFVRRNVGWLPTAAPLDAAESALENVMLALAVRGETPRAAEAGALRALALVGLDACAGRRVSTLSGGERQLVALARALAGPAPVVVLDEPTAGLGESDHALVSAALATVRDDGAAVLCTTADEALAVAIAARGGRRARLEDGKVHAAPPAFSLVPRATPVHPLPARERAGSEVPTRARGGAP